MAQPLVIPPEHCLRDIDLIGRINLSNHHDSDPELLYQKLLSLRRDRFEPHHRIAVLHIEHEYFYHSHPTGFTTHNFVMLAKQADIPLWVFMFFTSHWDYERSLQPFLTTPADCPSVVKLLVHCHNFRQLAAAGDLAPVPPKAIRVAMGAVLGAARPHRMKLFQYIKHHGLERAIAMTMQSGTFDHLKPAIAANTIQRDSPDMPRHMVFSNPHRINDTWYQLNRVPEFDELDLIPVERTTSEFITTQGFDFYKNFAVDIVADSVFDYPYRYCNERIMRPMLRLTPFVYLGPAHTLRHWQQQGLATFGDVWDESYDNIEDPAQRFMAVVRLLTELSELGLDHYRTMLYTLQDRLQHNRDVLIRYIQTTLRPIYNTLQNCSIDPYDQDLEHTT
jgi:hypothetical protein